MTIILSLLLLLLVLLLHGTPVRVICVRGSLVIHLMDFFIICLVVALFSFSGALETTRISSIKTVLFGTACSIWSTNTIPTEGRGCADSFLLDKFLQTKSNKHYIKRPVFMKAPAGNLQD